MMPARRRYSTVLLPLWLALIIAGDAAATLRGMIVARPAETPQLTKKLDVLASQGHWLRP